MLNVPIDSTLIAIRVKRKDAVGVVCFPIEN